MNQILSKAMLTDGDDLLWGLLNSQQQSCALFHSELDLKPESLSECTFIYNQSSMLTESVEKVQAEAVDGQTFIEIFEDTKGVVGLRAYKKTAKMLQPLDLDFTHSS